MPSWEFRDFGTGSPLDSNTDLAVLLGFATRVDGRHNPGGLPWYRNPERVDKWPFWSCSSLDQPLFAKNSVVSLGVRLSKRVPGPTENPNCSFSLQTQFQTQKVSNAGRLAASEPQCPQTVLKRVLELAVRLQRPPLTKNNWQLHFEMVFSPNHSLKRETGEIQNTQQT